MNEVVGAECLVLHVLVERTEGGWATERLEHTGWPGGTSAWTRFFGHAPKHFAWYDATRPERAQRNRLIDAITIIPPGQFQSSQIYEQLILPAGMHRHRQPRILLCDGASLLGWFGGFHPVAFHARQNALLRRLAGPLRRRLRIERQLRLAELDRAGLEVALDALGAPAFVVDLHGRVREASRSGRVLFDARRSAVRASLQDAVHGRPAPITFELTAIAGHGAPAGWLAVARGGSADAQASNAVARAAARWSLTTRRTSVLEQVVRGVATATIAAELGISLRAVELHVTGLFERAGVASRSALVAAVLEVPP